MKSLLIFSVLVLLAVTFQSCEKYLGGNSIGGSLSPMGEVGTLFSSTSIAVSGVSDISGRVVSVKDDLSSISGSAMITNAMIRSILSNAPEITILGDNLSAKDIKFKTTSEGIEAVSGIDPGIIVKYDAKVGDSYTTLGKKKRTVKSVSTTDDFAYRLMLIKVIEVEENTNSKGIKTITYWSNHKWGLVGVEIRYDDGSSSYFPVFSSTNN